MPLLEVAPKPAEPAQRRFLNRALSWIDFDRRVLELAGDPELPLLERVRYCGIASSNLDEFFAVRMAELYDKLGQPEHAARSRRTAAALGVGPSPGGLPPESKEGGKTGLR